MAGARARRLPQPVSTATRCSASGRATSARLASRGRRWRRDEARRRRRRRHGARGGRRAHEGAARPSRAELGAAAARHGQGCSRAASASRRASTPRSRSPANGRVRTVDVGRATYTTDGGEAEAYFVNFAGCGDQRRDRPASEQDDEGARRQGLVHVGHARRLQPLAADRDDDRDRRRGAPARGCSRRWR